MYKRALAKMRSPSEPGAPATGPAIRRLRSGLGQRTRHRLPAFRAFTHARRAARFGFLAALLCAWTAFANPSAPVKLDEVVVKTLADSPVRGRLRAFSLTEGLRLRTSGNAALVTVPADEVVRIIANPVRAAGPSSRGFSSAAHPTALVEVRLVGGDRLSGRPVRSDRQSEHYPTEETVLLDTAILGTLAVPLQFIDRWVNVRHSVSLSPQHSALGTQRSDDRLLLSNGDVVHGLLVAIDDRGITFETETVPMSVPHSQVVAVDLVAETPPWRSRLRAGVTFVDGSRLTTDELTYADAKLELTLFGDNRRTAGLDRVARIDVAGGRWVRITELKPISIQHTPMLSLGWPYVENANVVGDRMRIAGRAFENGLGVHSESSVMYDLAGEYAWFVTFLGIDDSAGALADVTAEIRVDGQVRHRLEHVTAGRLAGPVRIDVRGADRIELRTLFGENASIQDRFNWADAGLIRAADKK